ncbi:Activator of 90 kDa heat shock protein ATPase-like protein 1 [Acromyrmex echinatior]|uniref:Activator of 90 kDa heat shock protein ATPase-like protein 1 n=2 Tax=Acromyrmex TaxID=64782 RepID=F4W8S2_ACREC|nr:Activator of 90 kDa heat shock protein ATPase-like protein 1 [Acromyrmex echinatior]
MIIITSEPTSALKSGSTNRVLSSSHNKPPREATPCKRKRNTCILRASRHEKRGPTLNSERLLTAVRRTTREFQLFWKTEFSRRLAQRSRFISNGSANWKLPCAPAPVRLARNVIVKSPTQSLGSMAKWGEGDPRWIVEERPDATNVNNWHWTEKNACAWSQEKLKELFINFKIEGEGVSCKITEMEKCEGEAVANNRKGKLIFFYEWNIVLKWILDGNSSKDIEGKINIPNLSEENDISEVDIEVTLKDSTDEGEKVKQFLHTKGKDAIREKLKKYISSLKEEFTKGMILPKKDNDKEKENISNITSGFNIKMQMNAAVTPTNNKTANCKISTTTIKQNVKFQCRADEFYNVLSSIEMVQAFTKNPVKLEPKKNGQFELFGGNIHGEFIEITPTKIIQKWRCKQWPSGHFSDVTIDICEKNDHTEVNLTQSGVPVSEELSTKENWDRYYWDAIKRTFGFGYFM